jgi:hypothetical protein
MKTFQDKWNNSHISIKLSVVFLLLAFITLVFLGFAIPKFGIALLILVGCFGIAGSIVTLIVNPFK